MSSWRCSPSLRFDVIDEDHFAATLWAVHDANLDRAEAPWAGYVLIGFEQAEQFFDGIKQKSFFRVQEAVVSDLNEAIWQDVLEEAPDELFGIESHGARLIMGVFIGEGHAVTIEPVDAFIADSDPEDIGCEVFESGCAFTDGLDIDDPAGVPHVCGYELEEVGVFFQGITEGGA